MANKERFEENATALVRKKLTGKTRDIKQDNDNVKIVLEKRKRGRRERSPIVGN